MRYDFLPNFGSFFSFRRKFFSLLEVEYGRLINSPTVTIGLRCGRIPNEYWKNPLPLIRQGASPINLLNLSCSLCNHLPEIWSKISFSPYENTGTKWDLQKKNYKIFRNNQNIPLNSTSLKHTRFLRPSSQNLVYFLI